MARHDQTTPPGTDNILADVQLGQLVDVGQSLIEQLATFVTTMFRTWNLYQVAIAVGIFALAHLLRMILGPQIRTWMASRENWPK